jgi:hypothetical protein
MIAKLPALLTTVALACLGIASVPTAQADPCTGALDVGGCTDEHDGATYNCIAYVDTGIVLSQVTIEQGCLHVIR